MSLRELAASAFAATDLSVRDNEQGPADVLAAIATAGTLGKALWRYAYGRQDPALRRLWLTLTAECASRHHWPATASVGRLAALAIHEWTEGQCGMCDGRGGYMLYQHWLACPICNGTGIRRHSNRARRAFMGEWSQVHTCKLHAMLDALSQADGDTCRILARHLRPDNPYILTSRSPIPQYVVSDIRRGGLMAVKSAQACT